MAAKLEPKQMKEIVSLLNYTECDGQPKHCDLIAYTWSNKGHKTSGLFRNYKTGRFLFNPTGHGL